MALVRTRRTSRNMVLTLAEPQRQNALSAEMVAEIERALDAAPEDLAALLVEGEGGVFSAGADLKALSTALDRSPHPAKSIRFRRSMPRAGASSPASPRCPSSPSRSSTARRSAAAWGSPPLPTS